MFKPGNNAWQHRKKPYKLSEEHKQKIRKALEGRNISEEQKLLLRQRIGDKNPMFGKTHSDDYKDRLKREMIGSGNHNWKGGKTLESDLRLTNTSWEKRKREVYERDNYICQSCNKKCRGTDRLTSKDTIQCHHLIPWKETRDDSLNNLITLCLSCHSKIENNKTFREDFYAT